MWRNILPLEAPTDHATRRRVPDQACPPWSVETNAHRYIQPFVRNAVSAPQTQKVSKCGRGITFRNKNSSFLNKKRKTGLLFWPRIQICWVLLLLDWTGSVTPHVIILSEVMQVQSWLSLNQISKNIYGSYTSICNYVVQNCFMLAFRDYIFTQLPSNLCMIFLLAEYVYGYIWYYIPIIYIYILFILLFV